MTVVVSTLGSWMWQNSLSCIKLQNGQSANPNREVFVLEFPSLRWQSMTSPQREAEEKDGRSTKRVFIDIWMLLYLSAYEQHFYSYVALHLDNRRFTTLIFVNHISCNIVLFMIFYDDHFCCEYKCFFRKISALWITN